MFTLITPAGKLTNMLAALLVALLAIPTYGCDSNEDPLPDIVDTAISADFNTLVAAVAAADLVGTLKSEGPFTVFAPTDAAFAKLPAGTVDELLKPENKDQLAGILTYHVIPGRITADQVVSLTSATTAQGDAVSIRVEDGKVFVNDAQVVTTDIEASNGIIHIIDAVLLPPAN